MCLSADDDHGGDLQVRRLVGEYRQYMTLKGKYEHELGMSPAGRLSLGVKSLMGGGRSLEDWKKGALQK